MKWILALCLAGILGFPSFGQSASDALRLSLLQREGSARMMGLSGAMGAMGGDFSAININPAGVGVFRAKEISLTLGLRATNTESLFLDGTGKEFKYNFNAPQFGMVLSKLFTDRQGQPRNDGWVSVNFAFGMNRVANLHNRFSFEGTNKSNSMLDQFTNTALGTAPVDLDFGTVGFGTFLAYQTYLINPVDSGQSVYDHVAEGFPVFQSGTVVSSGKIDEYSFTIGANYKNKLYMGGTLGLPHFRYREDFSYRERDKDQVVPDFNSFSLNESLVTSGLGANFKFGLIGRPADWVRLGASIHSPTFVSLSDRYSSEMSASFETGSYSYSSPRGKFEYLLTTPWRTVTSIGFVAPKIGFLSLDYEWADYSKAAYTYEARFQDIATETNREIANNYSGSGNLRLGIEGVYEMFRFRAGAGIAGNPSVEGSIFDFNNNLKTFALGFGIREKSFFADLAYQRVMNSENFAPYTLSNGSGPAANLDMVASKIIFSAGFRF